jgi:hypothetical protein
MTDDEYDLEYAAAIERAKSLAPHARAFYLELCKHFNSPPPPSVRHCLRRIGNLIPKDNEGQHSAHRQPVDGSLTEHEWRLRQLLGRGRMLETAGEYEAAVTGKRLPVVHIITR